MKRLITTTAMAALMAAPLAAQTATQTETDATQMQTGLTSGQMEIQASNLIGKRLYILREPGGQDSAAMEQLGTGQTGDTMTTDQAATMPAEGAPEGEAQTADGMETTGSEVGTGEMAEGTAGQQPVQDQQMQTAEGTAPQAGAGMSGDMANLDQGVTEAPDTWAMAGEIDDVLMTQDGQVQALVIDAGGFLGMNQSTRRVDIQEVRFVPDTDDEGEFFAVYSGDRQTFEQAQAFDEASLQEGTVRGTEMWGDEIAGRQADVAATSITADDLVGTSVYGSNDNWVGEIGEIALTESGEIEAVIIDVGGFLGIGQKPVALTMEQIQLRRGEGGLFGDDLRAYVNATEAELESLPEWEEDAG